jgi:peptidoglycan/xylan/chitin deacetylase (PgdA/CDA1 family)
MTIHVPVLMYHSISDGPADRRYRPYVVSREAFARQIRLIRERGHTALTVSGLVRAWSTRRLPHRPVVVTFDDALRDFYDNALPILLEQGVAATLYVPTAFIGDRSRWLDRSGEGARPMMSWSQLRESAALGIECGAHSHSHVDLDILPMDEAQVEIEHSRMLLEDGIGRPVDSFAYPYGKHGRQLREQLRAAGFTSACAVGDALAVADADGLAIARVAVGPKVTEARLARWLDGQELRPAPPGEPLRTTAWRLVRRVRRCFEPTAVAFATGLPAAGIL